MDGLRAGSEACPLTSRRHISLDTIAEFLAGELDEERVSDLVWGLVLCDIDGAEPLKPRTIASAGFAPLPRAFTLLKLVFLDFRENQPPRHVLPSELFEKLRLVRPSPAVLAQLRVGDVPEACRTAARRLRASGFEPLPHAYSGGPSRDEDWTDTKCNLAVSRRIAASLLFPVRHQEIISLCEIVLHPLKPDKS